MSVKTRRKVDLLIEVPLYTESAIIGKDPEEVF